MSGRRAKRLRRENPPVEKASIEPSYFNGNRRMKRQAMFQKDRRFTKKGYAFGNKIGGRLLALAEHLYKVEHRAR